MLFGDLMKPRREEYEIAFCKSSLGACSFSVTIDSEPKNLDAELHKRLSRHVALIKMLWLLCSIYGTYTVLRLLFIFIVG